MLYPAGGSSTEFQVNIAYLFTGIAKTLNSLETETYIGQALHGAANPLAFCSPNEAADHTTVSRWQHGKFPLKVFMGADYGYLFSPVEMKCLNQMVQSVLQRIHDLAPEYFQFTVVQERYKADILIKFRKTELPTLSHAIPELGAEKQIKSADITINIPKSLSGENITHSQNMLAIAHNILHALGVAGHSFNPIDTGYEAWSSEQTLLSASDLKTLQLLYRCPIGMTGRELNLLWQEYVNKPIAMPGEVPMLSLHGQRLPLFLRESGSVKPSDLSEYEAALQQFFTTCIQWVKSS
jgi:hypothetical protein